MFRGVMTNSLAVLLIAVFVTVECRDWSSDLYGFIELGTDAVRGEVQRGFFQLYPVRDVLSEDRREPCAQLAFSRAFNELIYRVEKEKKEMEAEMTERPAGLGNDEIRQLVIDRLRRVAAPIVDRGVADLWSCNPYNRSEARRMNEERRKWWEELRAYLIQEKKSVREEVRVWRNQTRDALYSALGDKLTDSQRQCLGTQLFFALTVQANEAIQNEESNIDSKMRNRPSDMKGEEIRRTIKLRMRKAVERVVDWITKTLKECVPADLVDFHVKKMF